MARRLLTLLGALLPTLAPGRPASAWAAAGRPRRWTRLNDACRQFELVPVP
ncbi:MULTISPECIES: hypothetical protein [Streptomyces]|uniref:Uncharacterized protein n=1 Tax=Streptomyces glycanivorans TaxID=3033808 RepID=A0ABY9J842_9ACTN|nr:hypothetical protein [Streptomyces sp. Alt3]WLQ62831.1 hypothetical protein P8A20_04130 [Streptomyces sp. Alt3]